MDCSRISEWARAGGVDEIVDWSKTAPKRKQKRPADSAGDFDDKVRPRRMHDSYIVASYSFLGHPLQHETSAGCSVLAPQEAVKVRVCTPQC